MKLNELKNKDFIVLRNGQKGVVVNELIVLQNGKWQCLKDYKDDLTACSGDIDCDIVAVSSCALSYDCCCKELYSWERTDVLNKVEIEYLSNIINPFREEVEHISKRTFMKTREYIEIQVVNTDDMVFGFEIINLPTFVKGEMYKGMETNKKYTLKELGL